MSKNNKPVAWYDALKALLATTSVTDAVTGKPVEKRGSKRILLCGPPGTGKSRTAMILTETEYRVTMTEGTGVEDLIGMYQLRNGETIWADGPVTRAMREGKALLMDEVDHMPAEIQSLAYAILDDNPSIMLPTGEYVQAVEGYCVIGTTNANIGSLPEAIIDRFEAVLIAKDPHPDALTDLEASQAAAVKNHFRSVPDTSWKWSGKPTLRRMRAFAHINTHSVLCETQVAELTFGHTGKEVLSVLTTSGRTSNPR